MKIGYACINTTLPTSSKTFRLASYTEERFVDTVRANLENLQKVLDWNLENNILFFRISSGIIPFASHPVCTSPWQTHFFKELASIGNFIKKHKMRVSMHPDQFVLINSLSEDIFQRSVSELEYHAKLLDLMGIDKTHKLQIHVGGAYGEKPKSMDRFVERYALLSPQITDRLVIENDDRLFSLKDCLYISQKTSIPILFDTFHHSIFNNGESLSEALALAFPTWQKQDGSPIIDYSSQEKNARVGNHAKTIDVSNFTQELKNFATQDVNIMLEIKDKEASALKANDIIHSWTS